MLQNARVSRQFIVSGQHRPYKRLQFGFSMTIPYIIIAQFRGFLVYGLVAKETVGECRNH